MTAGHFIKKLPPPESKSSGGFVISFYCPGRAGILFLGAVNLIPQTLGLSPSTERGGKTNQKRADALVYEFFNK